MAEQLIDSLTRDFDPSAYRDEYREELLALIERKAEGKEIVAAPSAEEPKATKAPDLMAALEESIAAVKGRATARREENGESRSAQKAKPRRKNAPPRAKAEVLEIGRGRPDTPRRGRRA